MSDTKIALTDKQRQWATAFLQAMGGKGTVDNVTTRRESGTGKTAKPELSESLRDHVDIAKVRDNLAGKDEVIERRSWKDRDRKYKQNVVKRVDDLLSAVDKLLKKSAPITPEMVPSLKGVKNQLILEDLNYDGKIDLLGEEPDTEPAKQQFLDKKKHLVSKRDAVRDRASALTRLIELSQANLSSGDGRKGEIAKLDPATQAQMLVDNPEMFNAILAAKPPAAGLAKILSALPAKQADPFIKQLIESHADDQQYMEALCEGVLGVELEKSGIDGNTFMRSNSVGSKLTGAYSKTGAGAELVSDCIENTKTWADRFKNGQTGELNPAREKNAEKRSQAIDDYTQLVQRMLYSVMHKDVPREVATIASMLAAGARKKGKTERDVAILVGGHVFLRVISPSLIAIPNMSEEQQKAAVFASRLLQCASNDMTSSLKEPYMADLVEMVEAEIPALQQWFLEVAEEGDRMRGLPKDDEELEELIEQLEGRFDPAMFVDPSEDDPMGVFPANPGTMLGQQILTATANEPPPEGIPLPTPMNSSHLKIVERERKKVVANVVKRLTALRA